MADLFSPTAIGKVQLRNRIVIPPMCQYSANDGFATEWHLIHYGSLALSGAGLLIFEATAVEPRGRISIADLGLWDDATANAIKGLVAAIREYSPMPLGVQLGHAGRKASAARPWEGRNPLPPENGGWPLIAPSAEAYSPMFSKPAPMTGDDIARVTECFASAARRAVKAGFDLIEVHAAHGYLLHQFLSPVSNKRADEYGGSLENRMRFPLQVFEAVRDAAGANVPVGIRISGSDWVDGGWNIDEAVAFSHEITARGGAFIHVSGGGLSPDQKISLLPGYQVAFAERIKREAGLPTIAVGLITEPEQAQTILTTGQADMVAIGRAMLYDPRWPWHAAAKLGRSVIAPSQYERSEPATLKGLFAGR